MTAERTLKLRAVVIASRRIREKDRLVSFLSRDHGRVDASVFGARKTGGRWTGKFEPFNVVTAVLARKAEGAPWSVREVEVLFSRRPGGELREELVLQAAAELLYLASPGEGTGGEAYEIAERLGAIVAGAAEPVTLLLAFGFAWSDRAGFGAPRGELSTRPENLSRFVERAATDSPETWRRYRVKAADRGLLLGILKRHVETCTERRWRGVEALA